MLDVIKLITQLKTLNNKEVDEVLMKTELIYYKE